MKRNPKKNPSSYKVVCISLFPEDIARLSRLVTDLKRHGVKTNKSQVIREALKQAESSWELGKEDSKENDL